MDKIILRDMIVSTIIGVKEWERKAKQQLKITLILYVEPATLEIQDSLSSVVNYEEVYFKVKEFVENSSYKLIETLATHIADLCLNEFPIQKITVIVEKPNALLNVDTVCVEITREKPK